MRIKTKLVLCKDGSYRVKVSYVNGGKKTIRFFSAQELGFSNSELPMVDFRKEILENKI